MCPVIGPGPLLRRWCPRIRVGWLAYDDAVLSVDAKGMTIGDIANHLADIYGTEVSRDLVSRVTDAVIENMQQWQSRRLDPWHPVVLIDAIVLKIRDRCATAASCTSSASSLR